MSENQERGVHTSRHVGVVQFDRAVRTRIHCSRLPNSPSHTPARLVVRDNSICESDRPSGKVVEPPAASGVLLTRHTVLPTLPATFVWGHSMRWPVR